MIKSHHLEHLIKESCISKQVLDLGLVYSNQGNHPMFGKKDILLFKYHDLNSSEILGERGKLFEEVRDKKGKLTRYLQPTGSKLNCFLFPDQKSDLLENKKPLYVPEAEKKALALRSIPELYDMPIVSFPGCWNWTTKELNRELAPPWSEINFEKRLVYLIPDTDYFFNTNVHNAYNQFARCLSEKGATVYLIDLRENQSSKVGVDDYIREYGTKKLLKKLENRPYTIFKDIDHRSYSKESKIEFFQSLARLDESEALLILDELQLTTPGFKINSAKKFIKKERRKLLIDIPYADEENKDLVRNPMTQSLSDFNKVLNEALLTVDSIYKNSFSNSFTLIDNETQTFEVLSTKDSIAEYLSNKLNYRELSIDREGNRKLANYTLIPSFQIGSFTSDSRNFKGLRQVDYVSRCPIVKDHKILDKEGFNPESNFYYQGKPLKNVKKIKHLYRILNSFPFKSECDKTNMIGLLIGLFFVQYFKGQKPCIIILGDKQNLGKTTVAELIGTIFDNDSDLALMSFDKDEEMRKSSCSQLSTNNILCFDNVKKAGSGLITSPFLEKVITSDKFSERLLGGNDIFERINNFLIIFTLNKGVFSDDILTRSVIISLTEELYHVIDHSFDVIQYTKDNRQEILCEIGHFIKIAYKHDFDKIEFSPSLKSFKFKKWGWHIGKILEANNIQGFLSNQDEIKAQADEFLVYLEELLTEKKALEFQRKITATDIAKEIGYEPEGSKSLDQKSQYIGRRLSELNGKEFGNFTRYKVTKHISGNSSYYRFSVVSGSHEGNLNFKDKDVVNSKNNNFSSNSTELSPTSHEEPPF